MKLCDGWEVRRGSVCSVGGHSTVVHRHRPLVKEQGAKNQASAYKLSPIRHGRLQLLTGAIMSSLQRCRHLRSDTPEKFTRRVAESRTKLFAALAKAGERRVNDFTAQNLANMTWAFAVVGHVDAPYLCYAVRRRLHDFSA
eukprot:gnl/TRDRNA2_/TRDRNA2_174592_c9_seq15.p1 gnl/TRDRNA2_/TRDRNA2_174592_c9~~gnl/TRDRNA2_/TRDRNA2_174592_c9_seq15.p1  ORF type:complete len:141 (+),score=14.23 gnl/TRDRNA2_/TRDRNA2_174592_c9_seq15:123-545(+)